MILNVLYLAWFRQPKGMPDYLYLWFGKTVRPLISEVDGKRRRGIKPPSFDRASMWIEPPDPVFLLSKHIFDPAALWLPRVFQWFPHFFCTVGCPICRGPVEKSGATAPRRITDLEDHFYIVTWESRCRKCRRSWTGSSPEMMATLPRWLQLAFPAVLSRRAGISKRLMAILRSSNQDKMGPAGIRALLLEQHTLKYNRLLLQYLEAAAEVYRDNRAGQTTIEASFSLNISIPEFGHFGDKERYNGSVPTESYLTEMLNKVIEADEPVANQHTSLLAVDQISVDDSMKVREQSEF